MSVLKLLICVLLAVPSAAVIACEHPPLPSMPADGRISGRIERAVKQDMIRYVTEMSVYVACVQAEHSAAVRDGALDVQILLLASRNNLAVDELEAVRDVYVERVGPFEELFFDLPFDAGERRADAAPAFQRIPRGSDTVLRRAEQLRGGGNCLQQPNCFDFLEPGAE